MGWGIPSTGGGGTSSFQIYNKATNSEPAVFTSIANRDTYFTTNPAELAAINNQPLAVGIGTTDEDPSTVPDNGWWAYINGAWTNIIATLVGSRGADGMGQIDQNIPVNTLLIAADDNGDIVAGASAVKQMSNEVQSSMPISSPSGGAYRLGNLDIFNDGIGISVQDLAADIDYIPVAYERSNTGSERPTREVYQGQSTTPPGATSAETFTGATHQFAVRNTGRGTAQSYTFVVPANAPAVTDCNITIRYNSHTDATPVFDYKEATGGTGFTLVAGDGTNETNSVVTLPRAAFFPDGVDIYITITAGASQTLQLRGETLDLSSVGLGMQEVPVITVMGQVTVQKELADLDDVGVHPATLRRDMPSQEDALALAEASLNDNSAIWIIANNQLTNSNRNTATIVAQVPGLPDLDGNDIPTTPTDASTIQLRAGTLVRIFGQDDFRVVTAPVLESDIETVTDEEIRDVVGATLRAGSNVNIAVNDADDTITISSTGGGGSGEENVQADWSETDSSSDAYIRNKPTIPEQDGVVTNATLSLNGQNLTLTLERSRGLPNLTTSVTLPSTGGGGTPPTPGASSLYFGLSDENNPSSIDVMTLTNIDPVNPQTVSTGTTTSGQYFIILSVNSHDITAIRDTVLQQDVLSIFTKTNDVRSIGGLTYDSYVVGPLNAGVDESYVLTFTEV